MATRSTDGGSKVGEGYDTCLKDTELLQEEGDSSTKGSTELEVTVGRLEGH